MNLDRFGQTLELAQHVNQPDRTLGGRQVRTLEASLINRCSTRVGESRGIGHAEVSPCLLGKPGWIGDTGNAKPGRDDSVLPDLALLRNLDGSCRVEVDGLTPVVEYGIPIVCLQRP